MYMLFFLRPSLSTTYDTRAPISSAEVFIPQHTANGDGWGSDGHFRRFSVCGVGLCRRHFGHVAWCESIMSSVVYDIYIYNYICIMIYIYIHIMIYIYVYIYICTSMNLQFSSTAGNPKGFWKMFPIRKFHHFELGNVNLGSGPSSRTAEGGCCAVVEIHGCTCRIL